MNLDEIIARRYSVRDYDPRPVPGAELVKLCEAARLAPSACNSQTWRFVVVTDRAILARPGYDKYDGAATPIILR